MGKFDQRSFHSLSITKDGVLVLVAGLADQEAGYFGTSAPHDRGHLCFPFPSPPKSPASPSCLPPLPCSPYNDVWASMNGGYTFVFIRPLFPSLSLSPLHAADQWLFLPLVLL